MRASCFSGLDSRGFVFYTNVESVKGRELGQSESLPVLSLEVAPPPGAHPGNSRAGERRRGRRLLCLAADGKPNRRRG